jgi:hypothetical protein
VVVEDKINISSNYQVTIKQEPWKTVSMPFCCAC